MPLKNTAQSYGFVTRAFHWVMALMIIGLLAVGLIMTEMEQGPDRLQIYRLHKATGAVVLFLVVLRFGWRLTNITPLLPATLTPIQKLASHLAHYGLYGLMLLMPLSGWAMSSAAGYPVSVYGLFDLPNIVAPSKELRELMGEVHELAAYVMIALIVAHAAAALVHHFHYKDNVLRRMWRGW